jgi:hypothetical protein
MMLRGRNNQRWRWKVRLTDFHMDNVPSGRLMSARTLQDFHDFER